MITLLYASVLAILLLVLSYNVVTYRRKHQISTGDGGNKLLEIAARAHGNAVENIPFALLLIYLLEQSGLAPWIIHLLGIVLLLGRLSHAHGLLRSKIPFRFWGMVMTYVVFIAGAVLGLVQVVMRLV
ncbi:Inner membrane protein YecN [Saliniradius amylolyticus]|uniref:Inner membrane protein YecN n=1 Tax=Saliniradius amylolyticus TaxID=2183582 RepID=A0A2S2E413_9ALTE|nr:MAPEG family protein [Saliniradius amylolyticus]AWL11747.1 Inner membrane protein YecN [Saliniradius amylolyticus]